MSIVKYTKNELPEIGALLFIPKIKGIAAFFGDKFTHIDGDLFPEQVEKYVLCCDYVKYFGNDLDADWKVIEEFERKLEISSQFAIQSIRDICNRVENGELIVESISTEFGHDKSVKGGWMQAEPNGKVQITIKALKREYSGADKGGKRYEILDCSNSEEFLYWVRIGNTENDNLDYVCSCASIETAKQIVAALEDKN